MSFVLILKKKNFEKFLQFFWHIFTKTMPKMAKNGLKWPKMRFVLIFEKKIFEKIFDIFWHFHTKTIPKTPKNGLKWAEISFVLIFEKKISKNFENFFSIFIPKPYPKVLKMGSNDLISQFWANSSILDKLDFSLIWPCMSSNQAKTA